MKTKTNKILAYYLFLIEPEIPASFDKLLDKVHISSANALERPSFSQKKGVKTKKNRRIGGCTYGAIIG
ncbi:hypothetical protein A8709_33255 [Paenibacillus pectinilyticus]|uniref:Uncharacterized protein n=1 Tax=Paenibacillus pectinilyticus TaxID=512399 RepID=A0A1C0ZX63_9BACL|nr:hypothetical protein [Paenibacillus pectinilyticus]OCT12677.1 hypothetical protein A8709_33255 [Paenibacillus pectinilyticus]